MADNRMYIRCDVCGGCMIIAKCFGDTWGVRDYEDGGVNHLNEFFKEHDFCVPLTGYGRRRSDHYSLVYEDTTYYIPWRSKDDKQ